MRTTLRLQSPLPNSSDLFVVKENSSSILDNDKVFNSATTSARLFEARLVRS